LNRLFAPILGLLARFWVACINASYRWPVAQRARAAALLGDALWWIAWPRRRIALTNLRLCFPQLAERERHAIGQRCFRNIARAALDHSILWRGTQGEIQRFVRIVGGEHLFNPANRPLIMVAPHFVGLDAGGIRISTEMKGVSIYARQSNEVWDHWLKHGRERFNEPVLITRQGSDLRPALRAMKSGMPFYYLPDMDHGPENSIFVPFFGERAATLPMVSRIARLIDAKVVMAVTELTAEGYVLHIEAPWVEFPGASVEADTERMNHEIERWVTKLPDQYLWPHRRFKTRPPGAGPIY
jgi:KDO2-lipid IV(A) lauroyltransferase